MMFKIILIASFLLRGVSVLLTLKQIQAKRLIPKKTLFEKQLEKGGIKMNFPGEELITTAVEKIGEGLLHKMDEAEERRNREFSYKLKELEFYKSNYDKEIRSIFDKWFGYMQNLMISTNKSVDNNTKQSYQKKLDDFMKPENTIKLLSDTIKYCGSETSKALAVFMKISRSDTDNKTYNIVYSVFNLLATMKTEVLGQKLEPDVLLQVYITDLDTHKSDMEEARKTISKYLKNL